MCPFLYKAIQNIWSRYKIALCSESVQQLHCSHNTFVFILCIKRRKTFLSRREDSTEQRHFPWKEAEDTCRWEKHSFRLALLILKCFLVRGRPYQLLLSDLFLPGLFSMCPTTSQYCTCLVYSSQSVFTVLSSYVCLSLKPLLQSSSFVLLCPLGWTDSYTYIFKTHRRIKLYRHARTSPFIRSLHFCT